MNRSPKGVTSVDDVPRGTLRTAEFPWNARLVRKVQLSQVARLASGALFVVLGSARASSKLRLFESQGGRAHQSIR